ncbi:MAG TPA: hypothetical protein VK783_06955 [Bacteroidia bacterium]|jgi:hypothetical protein|nr:hypothetical protein [Bacteroidia bacterium]
MKNKTKRMLGKAVTLALFMTIAGSSNAQWSITGNTGTTPGTNFLGTTDAKDLVLKTDGTEHSRIVESTGTTLITTSYGTLTMGPQNTTWCHMYTSMPYFWFSAPLVVNNGQFASYYTSDLSLQTGNAGTGGTTRMTILNSNGNVGIGTTSPVCPLDVSGYFHISGNTSPSTSTQGAYLSWNALTASTGETDFINSKGGGAGGFAFFNGAYTSAPLMFISGAGNVGIATTSPAEKLDVNGADANGAIAYFRNGNYWNLTGANLGSMVYNNLTQANDNGIFWTNSTSGSTTNGFVIAPWQSATLGMRIDGSNGNFGMYSGTNVTSLTIGNVSSSALDYGTSYLGFNALRGSSGTWTVNTNTANNGGAIMYGDIFGDMRFVTIPNGAFAGGTATQSPTDAQVYSNTIMKISNTGKVVIGNPFAATGAVTTDNVTTPGSYTLYVAGGILTEQVRVAVANSGSWADYVFANDYKLKPLNEVEQYLKENKHLPEVPSADEVKDKGIDVVTMDATLLKKIEELTLYVIELQKQNNNLQANNKDNTQQIQQLQTELKQLSDKK